MPITSKFTGNVAGVPVGSPDDPPHAGEFFPDGDSAIGFQRRALPSETFLGRMINPPRSGRENGYLPENTDEAEHSNMILQRSFRITAGNATGQFPGPPDRTR
jgi:hypothetical protein